jgi:hypothetical protein
MTLIEKVLSKFGYYKKDNLVIGANCGCCGKWISNELSHRNDIYLGSRVWSLCETCTT